jgi:hypothetical protein
MDRAYVRLRLMSKTLTPEQVTQRLGMEPDHSWHAGDVRPHTTLIEREHGWELRAHLPQTARLEDQIDDLLSRLPTGLCERIKLLGLDGVQLSCAVYSTSVPSLNFSFSTLRILCDLGASLDLDLYVTEANWTE